MYIGNTVFTNTKNYLQLNDNGQWVRLIPSLNGGLYKFDGENLETVPITTDQLLHSSYRYSNDLVFSGAKEVYSYGKFRFYILI